MHDKDTRVVVELLESLVVAAGRREGTGWKATARVAAVAGRVVEGAVEACVHTAAGVGSVVFYPRASAGSASTHVNFAPTFPAAAWALGGFDRAGWPGDPRGGLLPGLGFLARARASARRR
jgi:hypothetical protein